MPEKYIKYVEQRQLLKYLIAGGTAFGSEYLSFLLLFYVFSVPLVIANTTSFIIGFLISFIFNRKWTFKAEKHYKWAAHHQLAAYLLLSLFNLSASNFLIYEFHNFLPASICKFLAAATIACWNFFIFRATIFKVIKH
jgi:putative flippase GtrA